MKIESQILESWKQFIHQSIENDHDNDIQEFSQLLLQWERMYNTLTEPTEEKKEEMKGTGIFLIEYATSESQYAYMQFDNKDKAEDFVLDNANDVELYQNMLDPQFNEGHYGVVRELDKSELESIKGADILIYDQDSEEIKTVILSSD